jgi:hypothetical protein
LEFSRKYAPFTRKDLHQLDMTKNLWWLLIWPRFIFYYGFACFWTPFWFLVTAGKDVSKLAPIQRQVGNWMIK